MNVDAAIEYASRILENDLGANYYYHNLAHTTDVIRVCEEIGRSENVSDHEIGLLVTAGAFHDIGFLNRYENNEVIGSEKVAEILPKYNYQAEDIKIIQTLILSTDVHVTPRGKLECILNDADYDYFGRKDYFRIAANLRKELAGFGSVYTDKVWLEKQISFVGNHKYYTRFSLKHRRNIKMDVIAQLKHQLHNLN